MPLLWGWPRLMTPLAHVLTFSFYFLQVSDWEQRPLSTTQIKYAAQVRLLTGWAVGSSGRLFVGQVAGEVARTALLG